MGAGGGGEKQGEGGGGAGGTEALVGGGEEEEEEKGRGGGKEERGESCILALALVPSVIARLANIDRNRSGNTNHSSCAACK